MIRIVVCVVVVVLLLVGVFLYFNNKKEVGLSPASGIIEMKLNKGSLTVIYDNKQLYDTKSSSKKDIENVMAILHQYPDFVANFFLIHLGLV